MYLNRRGSFLMRLYRRCNRAYRVASFTILIDRFDPVRRIEPPRRFDGQPRSAVAPEFQAEHTAFERVNFFQMDCGHEPGHEHDGIIGRPFLAISRRNTVSICSIV